MNDYKVKFDLPMYKDVYFFGHGIDIDNPYEMANEIINLKRQKQKLIDYLKEKINITDDFSEELEDEFYIGKTKAYKEILSKIEKE